PHRPDAALPGALPAGLPAHAQVVRGWLALAERASRLVLPEAWVGHADEITSVRCELALGAAIPGVGDDPAGLALAVGELVRMGERPDPWLPELVEAVSMLGPQPGWDADAGLAAAGRVLAAADESRAVGDLDRIVAGRG